jgi:hypothetical protein
MHGYLGFIANLTEYQQRDEMGRLIFWMNAIGAPAFEDEILKHKKVVAFSEKLGVNPASWEFDLTHYAEYPELFEAVEFHAEQCVAPFLFHYQHVDSNLGLVVTGTVEVNDSGVALVDIRDCGTIPSFQARSRERMIAAGIDPDTFDAVSHDREMSRKIPYLDYLQALLPQQRREAIFDLSEFVWGESDPNFLLHPKLASELARLKISELGIGELCHAVGPVEFDQGRCTAPLTYYLYGMGDDAGFHSVELYDDNTGFRSIEVPDSTGYFVEVHVLARVDNKPDGGGEISVEEVWMRTQFIDDPEEDPDPVLLH